MGQRHSNLEEWNFLEDTDARRQKSSKKNDRDIRRHPSTSRRASGDPNIHSASHNPNTTAMRPKSTPLLGLTLNSSTSTVVNTPRSRRRSLKGILSRFKPPSLKSPRGTDLGLLFLSTGDVGKTTWLRQCERLYLPREGQGRSQGSEGQAHAQGDLNSLFDSDHLTMVMYENLVLGVIMLCHYVTEHRLDEEMKLTRPKDAELVDDQYAYMCELVRLHDEYLERDKTYSIVFNYRQWIIREMSVIDLIDELWNGYDEDQSLIRYALGPPHYAHLMINNFYNNFEYWLSSVNRMKRVHQFIPLEDDLARIRVKTTGIVRSDKFRARDEQREREFTFSIVDVGGQRNERRKWQHVFADGQFRVDAVVFFVSLSEFNQNLYEAGNVNRMHESLDLFATVVNAEIDFKRLRLYVVFTKTDLFLEKVRAGITPQATLDAYDARKNVSIVTRFDDDDNDVEDAVKSPPQKRTMVPSTDEVVDSSQSSSSPDLGTGQTHSPDVEVRHLCVGKMYINNQCSNMEATEEEIVMRDSIISKYLEQIKDKERCREIARGGNIFVVSAVNHDSVKNTMARVLSEEINLLRK